MPLAEGTTMKIRTTILALALPLAACGVSDLATSTATSAKLQAEQAKQGQAALDKAQSALDGATKAQQERSAAAANEK